MLISFLTQTVDKISLAFFGLHWKIHSGWGDRLAFLSIPAASVLVWDNEDEQKPGSPRPGYKVQDSLREAVLFLSP